MLEQLVRVLLAEQPLSPWVGIMAVVAVAVQVQLAVRTMVLLAVLVVLAFNPLLRGQQHSVVVAVVTVETLGVSTVELAVAVLEALAAMEQQEQPIRVVVAVEAEFTKEGLVALVVRELLSFAT